MTGKGSFGTVYVVRRKSDGRKFVMKSIATRGISEKEKESVALEIKLLAALDHPGIVDYVENFVDPRDKDRNLCIVMGYCEGGDMTGYLAKLQKNRTPLHERDILYFLVQMCLALHFLHTQNILHRDLKTQNVFIKNGLLLLGDFGISKV